MQGERYEMLWCISPGVMLLGDCMCRRQRILDISEPYKMEILDGIKQEPITIYGIGGNANIRAEASTSTATDVQAKATGKEFYWWDLCAGPHLQSTGQLNPKAIELLSVAGAYWRGDETKPMLQVQSYSTCKLHL